MNVIGSWCRGYSAARRDPESQRSRPAQVPRSRLIKRVRQGHYELELKRCRRRDRRRRSRCEIQLTDLSAGAGGSGAAVSAGRTTDGRHGGGAAVALRARSLLWCQPMLFLMATFPMICRSALLVVVLLPCRVGRSVETAANDRGTSMASGDPGFSVPIG